MPNELFVPRADLVDHAFSIEIPQTVEASTASAAAGWVPFCTSPPWAASRPPCAVPDDEIRRSPSPIPSRVDAT